MLCTRCRRAEALVGKRSCIACREYNLRRRRYLGVTSAVGEQQSLYAMRTLAGHLKVGRSNDVHKRSKQLSADVIRVWPGLGRLEPSVHRHLEDVQVSREIFACPLEAVEFVVEHVKAVDLYVKVSNARLRNELRRWGSDANAGASSEPARPVDSADSPDRGAGVACSSGACSIACPGATSTGEDAYEAEGEGEGRTTASASESLAKSTSEEDAREA